ncbi:hypothetical protein HMPREF6745_0474 [Prevotella sp. oral taxon 472 str. F0295]|nr:hypothetical protein HMPREF6745_0474 [Prevotella sp. oral taxon 472 str. F0295]RKW60988.1 MAG: hypothetical protein D8H98_05975 [Prevotella sp.]
MAWGSALPNPTFLAKRQNTLQKYDYYFKMPWVSVGLCTPFVYQSAVDSIGFAAYTQKKHAASLNEMQRIIMFN